MYKIFFVAFVTVALSGCGVIDYYFLTPPEDTAQELYQNAQASMQEKDYAAAIESLVKLGDRYPFSPYSIQGRIMLGDAYFLNKQYREAIDTYDEFLSLHPRSEQVPYVLFQLGVSKYEVQPAIDLPQDQVAEAIEHFQRIIQSYPETPYVAEAQQYIEKCRRRLAEHELYIANFYWESGSYKAAWLRYDAIFREYGDIPDVANLADTRRKAAFVKYQEHAVDEELSPSRWKKWFDWL
ncbi:MAG: outer membrane protein assembly factor BamD [Desulfomicrobiaceae bacterium]|nr:outer membrane protein assembly factor BamD [Desulfomicrobiaceae bacterium]